MSILNSIKNLQEYGNNPENGYMDNVFLDIVQQKQRLRKPLSVEEQKFLLDEFLKRKKPTYR